MARKNNILQQIADRLEPSVRKAFIESITQLKSDVQIGLLTEAIQKKDIGRTLQILNLYAAYFAPLDRALTAAYQEAGDAMMALWMAQAAHAGAQARGVFDARNPRAEEWLREQSSQLIREVLDETKAEVRTLLSANFAADTAPRTSALDLVGRVAKSGPQKGQRVGGIIGLLSRDVKAKQAALDELRADPGSDRGRAQLRNYLNRKTRDKRFDSVVRAALRDGKSIPDEKARKMLIGMENKMLRNRGETIARTELLSTTESAQEEGLNQLVESGKVARENVRATWDTANDGAQRDSHDAMDGQVRRHGDPFVSGDGYQLLHPGDRSLGAPAEEIINCRCVKRPDIDWIAQAAQERRAS